MRILVVEDDKKIASFVARGLKEAGFAVDQAENGEARQGSYALTATPPDRGRGNPNGCPAGNPADTMVY